PRSPAAAAARAAARTAARTAAATRAAPPSPPAPWPTPSAARAWTRPSAPDPPAPERALRRTPAAEGPFSIPGPPGKTGGPPFPAKDFLHLHHDQDDVHPREGFPMPPPASVQ